MEGDLVQYLNGEEIHSNAGSNAKEYLLQLAEDEFSKGNVASSIYYQIKSLWQANIDGYNAIIDDADSVGSDSHNGDTSTTINAAGSLNEMISREKTDIPNNSLIQHGIAESKTNPLSQAKINENDFLNGINEEIKGIEDIQNMCRKMPSEWTILQLTKGSNCNATYTTYDNIHESDAAIYLTVIKHARSEDYPQPLCLRILNNEQTDLYKKFREIRDRFKRYTKVDANDMKESIEAKREYWKLLNGLDSYIAETNEDLKSFLFPWTFLFSGIPYYAYMAKTEMEFLWEGIDKFCNKHRWRSQQSRVLLSLAALNASDLTELQINAIADYLVSKRTKLQQKQNEYIRMLLKQEKEKQQQGINDNSKLYQHFPCLLIVDERLDHFYWEEVNIQQEFTRFSSMNTISSLYNIYKNDICKGYVNVKITNGCCILNPDNNLPKMELRMNSFFDYWLPHWKKLVGDKPNRDDLFNDYLCRSCYIYAGHGTGLQYTNGRHIAQQNIHCVVFLFGCDSLRLSSNGLYGELNGPHMYYHAAKCPAIVGTLLPGLDSHMDIVATDILSHWIAPHTTKVLPWDIINVLSWIKDGTVTPSDNMKKANQIQPTVGTIKPSYNIGSLCSVIKRIHQRVGEKKLFNTVPYICRGLPVWNCHVESLPFK